MAEQPYSGYSKEFEAGLLEALKQFEASNKIIRDKVPPLATKIDQELKELCFSIPKLANSTTKVEATKLRFQAIKSICDCALLFSEANSGGAITDDDYMEIIRNALANSTGKAFLAIPGVEPLLKIALFLK